MYMKNYYGFVYEWTDAKNGFKYIGSHYGSTDDGYVSSNTIVNKIHKKRPHDLVRTILEYVYVDDKPKLYEIEQYYLDKISDNELYTSENRSNGTYKFYNMKKIAVGGNGVGSNGKMKNTVKYYHRDTLVQRFFNPDEHISDEWIKGVPSTKVSTNDTKWYSNLKTNKVGRFHNPPSSDWKLGRNQTTTPKKVSTPFGIFESVAECSRRIKIKAATIAFRCRSNSEKNEYVVLYRG